MSSPTALSFSMQGDQYVGTPYGSKNGEIDCQRLVELMMRGVGLNYDLKGSNAWYREFLHRGWCGSPEACKSTFGCIPVGAVLFIWADDGGEKARGYNDGLGNASHIGVYIARKDGAIHSSASRGCVCYSKFLGRSINGGWNKVGLHPMFDYGEKINRILGGGGEEEKPVETITISGGNVLRPINMRERATTKSKVVAEIPQNSKADLINEEGSWVHINYDGITGYVMNTFVHRESDPEGEQISVDRSRLESVYNEIGVMLGLRG